MVKRKQFVILLIGPSGSGKGTQAKFLIRALSQPARGALAGGKVRYCQTGDLLRKFAKQKSEAARRVKKIMRRGDPTPGFIAAYIWKGIILNRAGPGENIIFDGSPRSLREAKEMDEVLHFIQFPLPIAVHIALTPKEATRRLLFRGRSDDTKQAIVRRLRFFKKDVEPVIKYYKKHKRLITVNGEQPPKKVWEDIRKAIGF